MDGYWRRRLSALAVLLEVSEDDEGQAVKRKRLCWTKPWMSKKTLGVRSLVYEELLECDPAEYKRLLRVRSTQFFELLARVQHTIERKETIMRPSLPAKTRLQITLRFLTTGKR
ncbi:hypothetical protein HPB49_003805 [Dermacentor silvarum]|uniref:Uncharacterized protein n=1 Tax=Dermacentor silvarum TaxID=543639 RepID=A0ACB8D2T0_DERSI|nr:hypothetical protein HPB49_003805 [Dermacentor silvarum]